MQSHAFTRPGAHTVRVRVNDAHGRHRHRADHPYRQPATERGFSPSGCRRSRRQTFTALTASASTDSDGTIVSYAWDTDNDGAFDDATGVQPFVWFPTAGPQRWVCASPTTMARPRRATPERDRGPHRRAQPGHQRHAQPGQTGHAGLFDAGASHDDGTITSYEWDLDGDGSFETQTRRLAAAEP